MIGAFIDRLQLQSSSIISLRAAHAEIAKHFLSPTNQDLMIANIQALMGLRNIGVEDLSKKAGKNRSYIGRLLRKDFRRFNPNVETIRAIAFALDVKPSTLVFENLRVEFQRMIKMIEGGN